MKRHVGEPAELSSLFALQGQFVTGQKQETPAYSSGYLLNGNAEINAVSSHGFI